MSTKQGLNENSKLYFSDNMIVYVDICNKPNIISINLKIQLIFLIHI